MQAIENMKGTVKKLIECGAEREAKYIQSCIDHIEADPEYQEMISKNTPLKLVKDGCPNCGSFNALYNIGQRKNTHCGGCGQKIDWRL